MGGTGDIILSETNQAQTNITFSHLHVEHKIVDFKEVGNKIMVTTR